MFSRFIYIAFASIIAVKSFLVFNLLILIKSVRPPKRNKNVYVWFRIQTQVAEMFCSLFGRNLKDFD